MTGTAIETIPTTWDDERDVAFFRITASLFSCEFTFGAGVLLASYDVDIDVKAVSTASEAPTTTRSAESSAAYTSHATSR
jgi:hypothetical protein